MTTKIVEEQVEALKAQARSRNIGQKVSFISEHNGGKYGPLRNGLEVVDVADTGVLGDRRDFRFVKNHSGGHMAVYSEAIDADGNWDIRRYIPGEWESRLDDLFVTVKNEVEERKKLREEREKKDLAARFGIK
jgi:hypothetical protein